MHGIVKKKSNTRIDLIVEPIKTGEFEINIKWKYYDDFKMNPEHYPALSERAIFNQIEGHKSLIK